MSELKNPSYYCFYMGHSRPGGSGSEGTHWSPGTARRGCRGPRPRRPCPPCPRCRRGGGRPRPGRGGRGRAAAGRGAWWRGVAGTHWPGRRRRCIFIPRGSTPAAPCSRTPSSCAAPHCAHFRPGAFLGAGLQPLQNQDQRRCRVQIQPWIDGTIKLDHFCFDF